MSEARELLKRSALVLHDSKEKHKMNWKPITDEIPFNRYVLLRFEYPQGGIEYRLVKRTEKFTIKFTIETGSDWEGDFDYNEKDNNYYCPAGYYEKMPEWFDFEMSYMGKNPLQNCTHFLLIEPPVDAQRSKHDG